MKKFLTGMECFPEKNHFYGMLNKENQISSEKYKYKPANI